MIGLNINIGLLDLLGFYFIQYIIYNKNKNRNFNQHFQTLDLLGFTSFFKILQLATFSNIPKSD